MCDWITKTDFDATDKIATVTALYNQLHVREICEQTMKDYTQLALESLEKVQVEKEKIQDLKQLALQLLARNE